MSQNINYSSILESIQKTFPFCISRKEAERVTGGLLSQKYLANLDSQKKGPGGRIRSGRKIAYLTPPFCQWLSDRLKDES